METETQKALCALCANPVSGQIVSDGTQQFCCIGCQTVYQILLSQNAVDHFAEHPIFQQAVKSGLISNPDLLAQLRKKKHDIPEDEWEKFPLELTDLWCPSCAEIIKLILLQHKGVRNCVVDYCTDLASVEYAPRLVSKETIIKVIQDLGYGAYVLQDRQRANVSGGLLMRLGVTAFFSMNIMMLTWPIYASFFSFGSLGHPYLFACLAGVCALPVVFYGAAPVFRRTWTSLKVGYFGMETLVSIGVSMAFLLSVIKLSQGSAHVYFDSMSMIVLLVLAGKWVETKAKFSAKDALLTLVRAVPRKGRRRGLDGNESFVPIKDIVVGDLVAVHTGERIVLDGVLVEGEGLCDEAVMTGEAIPVRKRKGDAVIAGSILKQGSFVFRVERTSETSTLNQVINLIQKDIQEKSELLRPVDYIVRYFVPIVVCLALGVIPFAASFDEGILRAISVLLISCPCAIGIAAPLAESLFLNGCAKQGALIRNRRVIQFLGKEDVCIFDKTGTITEGAFTVLRGLEKCSQEDLAVLRGLTRHSIHPISRAIEESIAVAPVVIEELCEHIGKGLEGVFEGSTYLVGSSKYMCERGIVVAHHPAEDVGTSVYFSRNGNCITEIALGDTLRQDAKECIAGLMQCETLLLSGDRANEVEKVARSCQIQQWKAPLSPFEKRTVIEEYRKQGKIVLMVGDGVNDAPSLTHAHVGISVVTASDLSIQVSDILLTTHHLKLIPVLRSLGKRCRRVIKQNLFWAFFYNVIGIFLALSGYLHPLYATSAMVVSSLMVVFNAMRLGRFS